jgi:hypothetical protein
MEEIDMKRMALALCIASLLVGRAAQAQENATLTLRSGQTVSGQLVDLGGVGYTVRVNGQDQHISQNDVAGIEFGGSISNAEWARFNGTPQIVLRNGQTIDGQLYDIGGTSPLRLTIKTGSGDRELSSNEVARILIARPNNAPAPPTTLPATVAPSGSSTITVPANQPWTPTGFNVSRGQTLTFNSTGEIQLSADSNDMASADGARSGRRATRAPVPQALAGALIGRIGNGQPFPIGEQGTIQMPANGQLFLGINDDGFADNGGSFQVTIRRNAAARH